MDIAGRGEGSALLGVRAAERSAVYRLIGDLIGVRDADMSEGYILIGARGIC